MLNSKEAFFELCDLLTPDENCQKIVSPEVIQKFSVTFSTAAKESKPVSGDDGKKLGLKSDNLSETDNLADRFGAAVRTAARIPRNASFESFNRYHLSACKGLIDILYDIPAKDFCTAIKYATSVVNQELLNYCVCVVARHREDCKLEGERIQLPSHFTTHPYIYVDISKFDSMLMDREKNPNVQNQNIVIDIYHDFTATDADSEHFVAYFREDFGVNLHHRHWHEVYPNTKSLGIIDHDRRGELFLYMHSQMLARYNFERLCNYLEPVKKFCNFREHIKEPYYPKLDEISGAKISSPRQPNAQLTDVNRDGMHFEVIDIERWLERLIHTIDSGYVINKVDIKQTTKDKTKNPLEKVSLSMDSLGNTIEAIPELSYNYGFYGDLHNNGHMLLAYCHDPDKRFKEIAGVMSKTETAMRDPMFYRWHAFIDDVVDRYRKTLNPYSLEEIEFKGIEIESVKIFDSVNGEENILSTFWQQDYVDIADGILKLKGHRELKNRPTAVFVKFTHLQHNDFTYSFEVNNKTEEKVTGVVRVFIAPEYDETKTKIKFNKLRRFMIELDKFAVSLESGKNVFHRESTCSSVTVPFQQTFLNSKDAYVYSKGNEVQNNPLSYCGCGWPHHLLIGKGTEIGYPCTLFVMITDYKKDRVVESELETASCAKSSISYCGVRNKKYPDKRPMGFPFDRPISDSEADLAAFMTTTQKANSEKKEGNVPIRNMRKIQLKVKFTDKTVPGATIPK